MNVKVNMITRIPITTARLGSKLIEGLEGTPSTVEDGDEDWDSTPGIAKEITEVVRRIKRGVMRKNWEFGSGVRRRRMTFEVEDFGEQKVNLFLFNLRKLGCHYPGKELN